MFGRRRRRDATPSGPGLEARPASATAASVVGVAGWDGPLPHLAAPVTVVGTTAVEAVAAPAGPRELDVIFHRLASIPPSGVAAAGLMAVWRRST